MNPIAKNILAVLIGGMVGMIVNMGIVMMSASIIPPPAGVDPSDMESLKTNMHLYGAKHFILPFLAHALGTLVGAFLAAKISANNHMIFAMVIGGFFLLGGIMAANMLPAPMWFEATDLILAYFPMAWLGWKLAGKS